VERERERDGNACDRHDAVSQAVVHQSTTSNPAACPLIRWMVTSP
jgi:hypothetical protein